MKPSERIQEAFRSSRERYSSFDIDTREVASLLNVQTELGVILDEQHAEIEAMKERESKLMDVISTLTDKMKKLEGGNGGSGGCGPLGGTQEFRYFGIGKPTI